MSFKIAPDPLTVKANMIQHCIVQWKAKNPVLYCIFTSKKKFAFKQTGRKLKLHFRFLATRYQPPLL